MITKAIKMTFNEGKINSQTDLVKEEKQERRKQMIRRLGEQSSSERKEKSSVIRERLLLSAEFKDASTVLAYVSLPQEVDTEDFIQEALKQGKRVGVPYIIPGGSKMIASEIKTNYRFARGPLGISQPEGSEIKAIPMEEIDLVVVPALAYDRSNTRLGRGKGFYDTFLSPGGTRSPKTIGIAFDFQVVERLPKDPHDRPVERVITENN